MNAARNATPVLKTPSPSGSVSASHRMKQERTRFILRPRIGLNREQNIESQKAVDRREAAWKDLVWDEDYRHWSPESQLYAPAEVLLQYLRCGWTLSKTVGVKTVCCVSRRYIRIYSFGISNGTERKCIPVVSNPPALNLIRDYGLTVTNSDFDSPPRIGQ